MAKSNVTRNKTSLKTAAQNSSDRIHVIPTKDGWSVKREGGVKSTGVYRTKNEAISGASSIKRKSSIIIHMKDGRIERWSGEE